jgi:septum site-determining protein MinC
MADFGGAKRHRQSGKARPVDRPRDGKAQRAKASAKARSAPRPAIVPASDLERLSRRELVALVAKLNAITDAVAPAASVDPAAPVEPAANIDAEADAVSADSPAEAESASRPSSLCVPTSVRSGQSIIFPDGDVTVVGSVSSGAEIVAGGSIHIYGALRGRAIAGNSGNADARIFCRSFDAELLAIDGSYRVAENLDPKLRGRAVQAWLDGSGMTVASLD